ncbi:MAG: S9 family peptidase [Proteobacteria bacterium]|nr:S9 family peptidase [Pseudomonadota bacterium]
MRSLTRVLAALCALIPGLAAADGTPFNAAAAFGARPSAEDLSLSPDGQNLAWIAPAPGQGSVLYTLSLAKDAKPKAAAGASGNPERLGSCNWVSNSRLVCTIFWLQKDPEFGVLQYTRLVAVDSDGSNVKQLSNQQTEYTHGYLLGGGQVIDWLPDSDGSVLVTRHYLPNDHIGTRVASTETGLGVEQVDTRTLQSHRVEAPRREAAEYITDGHGHVRLVGNREQTGRGLTGAYQYEFHPVGSDQWQPLSTYQSTDDSGFLPLAVDPEQNVAYGYQKLDGRLAIYTMTLDAGRNQQLVYSNPNVDVDGLIFLGRQQRVVGVTYVTDYRRAEYFAPDIKSMIESLARALHSSALNVVGASTDQQRMLVQTSSDVDPGVYYIFDRKSRHLQTLFVVRNQLEGVKLATVRPVTYAASDGTQIPGYLTLPAGAQNIKGLPAIVMPHGGPSARDEWGFDWFAQFFANRGFVVLQPNFRGSAGYGDAWFRDNGFKKWDVAIGDVVDAGRWLVSQGADPNRLGIVGWSYGGYAALQSAAVEPGLFKAVVAVAPVTDLALYKEQYRHFGNFELASAFIGEGAHVGEGSPATHADRIKAPVLLFHGGFDHNVNIEQSQRMESALKAAGGKVTLVTWGTLDHYLEDSAARTEMLSRSDAFLRAAFGM